MTKIAKNIPQANPERGEVVVFIDGKPHVVRFGLRFLKTLTDQQGGIGPGAVLEKLATAPLAALIDMATVGIGLSVPADELPANFDALALLDEMTPSEQEAFFATLLNAVTKSPILAVLNSSKTA